MMSMQGTEKKNNVESFASTVVIIKNYYCPTYTLRLEMDDKSTRTTILEIKRNICKKHKGNPKVEDQILLYNGVVLTNDTTIEGMMDNNNNHNNHNNNNNNNNNNGGDGGDDGSGSRGRRWCFYLMLRGGIASAFKYGLKSIDNDNNAYNNNYNYNNNNDNNNQYRYGHHRNRTWTKSSIASMSSNIFGSYGYSNYSGYDYSPSYNQNSYYNPTHISSSSFPQASVPTMMTTATTTPKTATVTGEGRGRGGGEEVEPIFRPRAVHTPRMARIADTNDMIDREWRWAQMLNWNMLFRLSFFLWFLGQHSGRSQFILICLVGITYYLHHVGFITMILRQWKRHRDRGRNPNQPNRNINGNNPNAYYAHERRTHANGDEVVIVRKFHSHQLVWRCAVGMIASLWPEWHWSYWYPTPPMPTQ